MTQSTDDAVTVYQKVVERFAPGGRLLDARPLGGGISATTVLLEYVVDDARARAVLRRHGDIDFARDPHIAVREYELLHSLQSANVRVAAPIYVDATDDLLGRPYVVCEFVDAKPLVDAASLTRLASTYAAPLAALHRVRLSAVPFEASRTPRQQLPPAPARLDQEIFEPQTRALLARLDRPQAANAVALLHGDYWPGNVLWRNDEVQAVVDWEDFGFGDPLADVANARLELLWAAGEAAVDRFTEAYFSANPVGRGHLAYWDLCATVPFAFRLDDITDSVAERRETVRRLEDFLARAFAVFDAPFNRRAS